MGTESIIDMGTITGVIGAISGVAGSIMGFIAFRHSRELKAADRLMELRKLRNDTHILSIKLTETLATAKISRERVLAATGKFKSGSMEKFNENYTFDMNRSVELAQEIPLGDYDFSSLSRSEMEEKIIELDMTKRWIESIFQKYKDSIASDDQIRKELRNRK